MSGSAAFFDFVKNRRSVYKISSESPIPDEKIEEIVKEAVKHTPTSFNSQSSRAVVLFGEDHKKLWDITLNVLREIVPPENFPVTEAKIKNFAAGHGTVLFFEDQEVIKKLQSTYPIYHDQFPGWSEHANGMLQFVVWTALEAEGLGATLQHYNPLITPKVMSTWNLPTSWSLIAQMPFGKPAAPPSERTYAPIEGERYLVFGKQ